MKGPTKICNTSFCVALQANLGPSGNLGCLAAGGLGFILGDGKLNYGLENAYETYYRWKISSNVFLTANFQLIVNPGFNQDRGPVFLEALRAHAEF